MLAVYFIVLQFNWLLGVFVGQPFYVGHCQTHFCSGRFGGSITNLVRRSFASIESAYGDQVERILFSRASQKSPFRFVWTKRSFFGRVGRIITQTPQPRLLKSNEGNLRYVRFARYLL